MVWKWNKGNNNKIRNNIWKKIIEKSQPLYFRANELCKPILYQESIFQVNKTFRSIYIIIITFFVILGSHRPWYEVWFGFRITISVIMVISTWHRARANRLTGSYDPLCTLLTSNFQLFGFMVYLTNDLSLIICLWLFVSVWVSLPPRRVMEIIPWWLKSLMSPMSLSSWNTLSRWTAKWHSRQCFAFQVDYTVTCLGRQK